MTTRLPRSFAAVYRLLERPSAAARAVVVLLIVHTLLLGYSAYVHSPTLNEPGHLVAGISNWKLRRFDIYSVDPPLVQMVGALPVIAAGYKEDWSDLSEEPGARPEFRMGEAFVKANGARSFFLFTIARWACLPFSWIGIIVCYLWARDLYSRPAGIFASTVWCFEPNILAHSSLITADAQATALALAASYAFWRWLKHPTWLQAWLAGISLGVAELSKTTLILFFPLWPFMWIFYRRLAGRQMTAREWRRELGMLAVQSAIGLYVLNLGYGFDGSFTQLKDFQFVSDLFGGTRTNLESENCNPQFGNRFANMQLANLRLPIPKSYLIGIDIQQKDFEHYGRPSYLRGEWRDHGWWYYYLYACAIKVPLGLWALVLLTIVCRVFYPFSFMCKEKRENTAGIPRAISQKTRAWRLLADSADIRQPSDFCDELVLICPAVAIFTVVSSKTGFNEHMRYVLPAFPYIFIALSWTVQLFAPAKELVAGRLTKTTSEGYVGCWLMRLASPFISRGRQMTFLPAVTAGLLSSWAIASSLWIYPHSLSYFNESFGGPLNGSQQLLGSNVDWGQDLRYLIHWSDVSGRGSLYVIYHGGVSPPGIGVSGTFLNAQVLGRAVADLANGSLVSISVTITHGYWSNAKSSTSDRRYPVYKYLLSRFPKSRLVSHCGYSIAIWELRSNDWLPSGIPMVNNSTNGGTSIREFE